MMLDYCSSVDLIYNLSFSGLRFSSFMSWWFLISKVLRTVLKFKLFWLVVPLYLNVLVD